MNPTARTRHLVVIEVGGDTLVYDLLEHRAHSLDATAARLWRFCDGTRDVAALAALLADDASTADAATHAEVVRYALARLAAAGLVRTPAAEGERPVSRRALLRRAAATGMATLAVPTVLSLVAPTTLQAQASCLAAGFSCVLGGMPCCAPFACHPVKGQGSLRSCR